MARKTSKATAPVASPLNINQVRAAADKNPPFVDVEVEDWGGSIRLRRLRASQYLDLQAQLDTLGGKGGGRKPVVGAEVSLEGGAKIEEFYAQLVGLSAVDGGGRRIFEKAADLEHLRSSPGVLMKLGVAAMELNGLNKDPKESKKNSEPITADDSPSESA